MNEIPSPTQTYDGRALPPANEFHFSALVLPIRPDWRLKAEIDSALYGDVTIEVVKLVRLRWFNQAAKATYLLWSKDREPCQIENLCDECKGKGRIVDPIDREWYDHDCIYCEGRGWFYDD